MSDKLTREWILSPDRTDVELNEAAAVHAMGWVRTEGAGYHDYKDWWKGSPRRRICTAFKPASDHNDAAELLEKVPKGRCKIIRGHDHGGVIWGCDVLDKCADARTMSRAITRAVLLLAADGELE